MTIIRYLKKGNKYGWCFYDTKEEMAKSAKKASISTSKKVAVYKDGDLKGVYFSASELDRKSKQDFGIKFNRRNIQLVCTSRQKTHKGYTFKYLE